MRSVGLKVLKNRLSEFVKIAASGETVLVTDRDRVVAELTAPNPGRTDILADALLADAVRSGWLRPPSFSRGHVPPRMPIAPLEELLSELRAGREDR